MKIVFHLNFILLISIFFIQQDSFALTLYESKLCKSDSCRNNGECEQLKNNFECHCTEGKKGKYCEFLMNNDDDPCLSNPCWNMGECRRVNSNDYRCVCSENYGGKNCRELKNFICLNQNNLCQNNGICLASSSNKIPNITCLCLGEWTGQFCETRLPMCSEEDEDLYLPCYNDGICINNVCVCPQFFYGKRCETFGI